MQTPPHLSEISHPACPQLLPSHRPFTLCSRLVLSELRPPVRETEPTTSSGSPSPGLGGGGAARAGFQAEPPVHHPSLLLIEPWWPL